MNRIIYWLSVRHISKLCIPFQTYCIDAQVPDSACTATSYLTGVKTKYGVIGLDGNVTRGSCFSQLYKPNWSPSIGQWALAKGLDVGKFADFYTITKFKKIYFQFNTLRINAYLERTDTKNANNSSCNCDKCENLVCVTIPLFWRFRCKSRILVILKTLYHKKWCFFFLNLKRLVEQPLNLLGHGKLRLCRVGMNDIWRYFEIVANYKIDWKSNCWCSCWLESSRMVTPH